MNIKKDAIRSWLLLAEGTPAISTNQPRMDAIAINKLLIHRDRQPIITPISMPIVRYIDFVFRILVIALMWQLSIYGLDYR